MKEKIYIDFDGTLFDTDNFYQEFLHICLKYGITKDKIDLIKAELFKDTLFNIDKMVDYLVLNYNVSSNIKKEVEDLYSNKFVYDDVVSSLDKLKDKYDLILLTFGEHDYQTKKINGSLLKKYFKDIIMTGGNKSLLKNVDYKNSIFIDNNPKEIKRFMDVGSKKVIRIRRDSDKYSKIDLEVRVNEYKSFKEILEKELGI